MGRVALRMKYHLGAAMADLRFEPTPARILAFLDGQPVLDSRRAVLLWEPRRIVPVYAVPAEDLVAIMSPAGPEPDAWNLIGVPMMLGPEEFWLHTTPGTVMDLEVDGRRLQGAGFALADPDLDGMVALDFGAFDQWWAEDEALVAHPHDPFKRIDVLASSRRVEVSLDGTVLASTGRAKMLLETHLPVRYYIRPEDVRMDLLVTSETRSACAYKGIGSYLSTRDGSEAGRDIAWHYPDPLDDALRVSEHICFWAERTDLVVDGEPLDRPVTPWSRPEEQAGADPDRLEFG
jgi:uncharacterized protein (DUF427 family)